MWTSSVVSYLTLGLGALSSSALAQSYNDIAPIKAVGQHFFYSNNGTQFLLKGVAYQEDYNPNGTANNAANTKYTDPLADASKCSRDIPVMKKIFTNVIRVYAIDPTQDHDDCMEQLASNGIYVIADLGEPGTSIDSDNPEWNVGLYQRYTAVIDSLSKYKNVIGFFAGNEVVEKQNQTSSAAFVKAAVRDTKAYIKQMNYRDSLGVGYATADVPSRDELAHYFACEPEDGVSTSIDFWGYNVYSWCGDSNYQSSSYGTRVDFFKDYPVPAFFAEYGCIEGVEKGHRPFTEVAVLYGNMTSVFSGGIVYEYFEAENHYGLVSIDGDSVSPYPEYTSLSSQLAKVTPSLTQSSAYKPSNTAPACPSVGGTTWAAAASPLPPAVNPQLCECEVASLQCNIDSDDEDSYAKVFDYICGSDPDYCKGIAHNSTTGTYGALGGCSPKQQLAWVANQLYINSDNKASACDFEGLGKTQSPQTSSGCQALISAAGTNGEGSVVSPTGQQGTAAASSSSEGAAVGNMMAPSFFNYGKAFFAAYVITALVSGVGMFML